MIHSGFYDEPKHRVTDEDAVIFRLMRYHRAVLRRELHGQAFMLTYLVVLFLITVFLPGPVNFYLLPIIAFFAWSYRRNLIHT